MTYDFRKLTHEELARVLGVPIPAVKAWMHQQRIKDAKQALAAVSPDCPQPVHEDRSDEKNRAKKGREM